MCKCQLPKKETEVPCLPCVQIGSRLRCFVTHWKKNLPIHDVRNFIRHINMCLDICHHICASISCLTSGFVFYAKTVKKNHGLRIAISTLSMHKSKSISTYRNIENMLLSDLTYNIRGEHKHDRISGIFATSNFLFWNIRSNGGQCACAFKKYRVFRLGCNYLPKQSFLESHPFLFKG